MARGSIRKTLGKNGPSYKVTYDLPATAGLPRRQRAKTFRTLKAAEQFLTTVRHDLLDNREEYHEPLTFRALSERYVAMLPPRTRPATRITIQSRLDNHLLPVWGEREVEAITPPLAQSLADSLTIRRAPQTVRLIMGLATAIFERGIGWGIVKRNPCTGLRLPKVPAQTRSETWNAATIERFFALYTGEFWAVYRLIAMTGMRRGEALALRWCDFDRANSRLLVRRTLRWDDDRQWMMGDDAKTPGSERAIALDPASAAMLVALRSGAGDEAFIFTGADGGFLNPDVVTKRFVRFVGRQGLPPLTIHGLRHTHASLLGAAGVDLRTIMERLGHSTPTMTLGRYMHGSVESDRKAATAFAAIVRVQMVSNDPDEDDFPLPVRECAHVL